MYVCLCVGATAQTVTDAVAAGASNSKEVAAMCGAGSDCGRCRCTVRSIIASASDTLASDAFAEAICPPNARLLQVV